MSLRREIIHINGIVQGVGFRPFVYRLAQECQLAGFVNNSSEGVLLEVEGTAEALAFFHERLRREAPPLAHIVEITVDEVPPRGETSFAILASSHELHSANFISPDVSLCEACLQELFDPHDRRYRYPFINCTNCGPRYTIVYSLPYDRSNTSMRGFAMCAACAREYHDPADRRFHAQPNACPTCGPQVTLHDRKGAKLYTFDPIRTAATFLQEGKILAVRGLGGFHLAVDAHNETAVRELRRRKGRAEKPFALMAPDLACIEKFCLITPEERELLLQPARPIVLLLAWRDHKLAHSVAPQHKHLGFMLPYTPLQHLLLREHFEAMVMTSGNHSEEPIAIGNDEALARLANLADYFLLHDREILQRCDDAIVRYVEPAPRFLRRSRGYVPAPVFLAQPTHKRVLACGGELKNTLALSRARSVFFSQHIGDLDNPSALAFFENSVTHLQNLLEIEPELLAYDLHPEYLSTKWALRQELPKVGVQHHHAHLVAVMAENGCTDKTIGIILDGTGYGIPPWRDTIWGGEVLIGDAHTFERFAWLQPVPMPGGTAAIHEPWRMALSHLFMVFGDEFLNFDLPFLRAYPESRLNLVLQMIGKNINSPLTSSCGRLFDAVAALLDLRQTVSYEAQAAIELEMIAEESHHALYRDALAEHAHGGPIMLFRLMQNLVHDLRAALPVPQIAACFQRTLVEMFVQAACNARRATDINCVGLSGGVFQNVFVFTNMMRRLHAEGFTVLTHKQVPTNDGGLALGQVVIADAAVQ